METNGLNQPGRSCVYLAPSGGRTRISRAIATGKYLADGAEMYTARPMSSTHVSRAARFSDVTETSTHRLWKAPVVPVKLPATGVTWWMPRPTAMGIRLKPPTERLVGSKVIQPAPGTK